MSLQRNDKIILIEDDQKMLSLLTTLLGMEGYKPIPMRSPSPEIITATVEQERPAAVVLDVHLSDQNGIDLLRAVRSSMAEYNVHVLMTSGEDLRKECLAAGADGFLLKPYMPGELIDWLNEKTQPKQIEES